MAGTESPGRPGVIAARSVSDEEPSDLGMDTTSRALFVALWAWNTSTLAWEKVANVNSKLDTIITHLETIANNTGS